MCRFMFVSWVTALTIFISSNSWGSRWAIQEEKRDHSETAEHLWDAARRGDTVAIARLLSAGVPVDAATPYGSTALCFASDRGHVEAVKLLLEHGANPNVRDTFYFATPLTWARTNRHYEVVKTLFAYGAEGVDDTLLQAIDVGSVPLAESAIFSGRVSPTFLALARRRALAKDKAKWGALFSRVETVIPEIAEPTAEQLLRYLGVFATTDGAFRIRIALADEHLTFENRDGPAREMFFLSDHEFYVRGIGARIKFVVDGERVAGCVMTTGETRVELASVAEAEWESAAERSPTADAPIPTPSPAAESNEKGAGASSQHISSADDWRVSQVHWPCFRGTGSRGIADGQSPPLVWDAAAGVNLLWRMEIPGLGNSCPVIWGDHLFITTAVSEHARRDVRIGLYGDVNSVEDDSVHEFMVFCLHKKTGKIIWQRTVHKGRPAVKRHSKSSHANPTVAVDERYVVSFFGSEGLYCHDFEGNLIWQKDLGFLDSGWFLDAGYQWGFGSSPVLFEDRVIVQCDIQRDSFIAAFELATGNERWRVARDEIPTWPTPVVHRFGDVPMLITHGTRAARGYDARDGTLLWSLPGHSEIVVPTPFVAHDLIYLASGYAPVQPIFALRPSARGEINWREISMVASDESLATPAPVAWSTARGGPYMPTPLVYGDLLYVCSNNGILTCYDALNGEQIYKERIKVGGTASFTASLIAADGHLFATAEDGRVAVIRAGRRYELVGVNPCGESVLATPAISAGVFYLRSIESLMAFADSGPEHAPAPEMPATSSPSTRIPLNSNSK